MSNVSKTLTVIPRQQKITFIDGNWNKNTILSNYKKINIQKVKQDLQGISNR